MRELLFRGKKVKPSVFDETDWVYGSLIDSGNHEQVAIYPWYDGASTMSVRQLVYSRMEAVKPETVGQFIGLTDKNGKNIFEGDILDADGDVYVCFWDEGNFEFGLKNKKESFGIAYVASPNIEILGNIYDNPELLKEVAQ